MWLVLYAIYYKDIIRDRSCTPRLHASERSFDAAGYFGVTGEREKRPGRSRCTMLPPLYFTFTCFLKGCDLPRPGRPLSCPCTAYLYHLVLSRRGIYLVPKRLASIGDVGREEENGDRG